MSVLSFLSVRGARAHSRALLRGLPKQKAKKATDRLTKMTKIAEKGFLARTDIIAISALLTKMTELTKTPCASPIPLAFKDLRENGGCVCATDKNPQKFPRD